MSVSYVSVCVCVSEGVFPCAFNSAILSLITLWQRLCISGGVGGRLLWLKSRGRKGLKRERGEGHG